LTAVDLFAGCGGLTHGLKAAGFRVLAAVENDGKAAEAYRANHPEAVMYEADIGLVNPRVLMRGLALRKGSLDLLAGCPPCQGFSSMRTLNGSRVVVDEKNELVFAFLNFALAMRPKTVLMENVPALARDSRLTRVQGELERAGYKCRVKVLDAADYGVPQRRRRMLLTASRMGAIEPPDPVEERKTVRDAIEALPQPGLSGDPLHDLPVRRSSSVLDMIRMIPKDGGSRSDLGPERQLACHRRCNGFKDVYGRMKWDDVAPTITSGCINPSKGRFLHPEEDRAITLREAALLQGFSPDYQFPVHRGRYPLAELIGNAIPAEFVRRQAEALLRRLEA